MDGSKGDAMSTNWETADVLKTPMEVCWQFDYEIDNERLKNLYSKSKRAQWDAEQDLDWSVEIDPSRPLIDEDAFGFQQLAFFKALPQQTQEAFRTNVTAYQLSQFLHGEQGALMTAAALTHAVPDYEGKLYAATQTMDEARHVEVYQKYVDKLAMVYPMGVGLKQLIDVTLTADHWIKIAIGMNMVVEGLALAAFHNMRRATSCDLLRKITEGVLRDESRHVAFGNVYVGQGIAQLHPDDREDIAQFAFDAVKLMSDSRRGRSNGQGDGGPGLGADPGFLKVLEDSQIDPTELFKGIMESREQGIKVQPPSDQVHAFKDLMMPALVRVGAVTERSRALYADAKITVFEDRSVLESLEDSDTGTIDFD
jgi:hypothetical protein